MCFHYCHLGSRHRLCSCVAAAGVAGPGRGLGHWWRRRPDEGPRGQPRLAAAAAAAALERRQHDPRRGWHLPDPAAVASVGKCCPRSSCWTRRGCSLAARPLRLGVRAPAAPRSGAGSGERAESCSSGSSGRGSGGNERAEQWQSGKGVSSNSSALLSVSLFPSLISVRLQPFESRGNTASGNSGVGIECRFHFATSNRQEDLLGRDSASSDCLRGSTRQLMEKQSGKSLEMENPRENHYRSSTLPVSW